MIPYLVKRISLFIPTVLGVILIVYFIMDFSPGDPARLILGEGAAESQLEILRDTLGLRRPFFVRYADYVYRLVCRGDMGLSYRSRTAVSGEIVRKFPNTLLLAFLGMFLGSLAGIPLGLLAAVKHRSPADTFITVGAVFLVSIPAFWLAMLLLLLFSLKLGLLPASGAYSFRHFILPALTLAAPASGRIIRLTRAMMLETTGQDYIRTARAKGLPESRVILKHALKNALVPIITSTGMHFGYLLGGAVITETVFGIPGLGTHVVNAIRMKDTPAVLGTVVFLSVFFCLVMLLTDLACALIDPRIRASHPE
jgi:peptide/nickel transport system permease protein